ncbi:class I SAM-dependent methyltransferase [Nocardioides sp. P5_C9_2]
MAVDPAFAAMLDESLAPRDPSMLLATVRSLDLPPDSLAVDVGCGTGGHAFRLAAHFGLRVVGIDPVQRHLDRAREARRGEPEAVASRVSFERGTADRIPLRDGTVDLVWCRDSLPHVPSLASAYREFARVLRPGGRALVHQVLATDLLAPEEADWLLPVLGVVPASVDLDTSDGAVRHSGLVVDASVDLGSEWVEHEEETSGAPSRALLHAARLQRDPERYRAAFGDAAYDVMLAECLWLVYLMLGKLTSRVHLLSRP